MTVTPEDLISPCYSQVFFVDVRTEDRLSQFMRIKSGDGGCWYVMNEFEGWGRVNNTLSNELEVAYIRHKEILLDMYNKG